MASIYYALLLKKLLNKKYFLLKLIIWCSYLILLHILTLAEAT